MKIDLKVGLSHGIPAAVFVCFVIAVSLSPAVNGQYETENNLCGGIFRSVNGSIDFKFNSNTNPDPGTQKVCMWTIIPNPFQQQIEVQVESITLNCPSDKLGFTAFVENSNAMNVRRSACNIETFTLTGSVLVVTLTTPSSQDNVGFKLRWYAKEFYSRIRFVTTYYSDGKASQQPLPYFAAGFMGNSLSTFGFPRGNGTAGYTLQMSFEHITLLDGPQNCPTPLPGPMCNALLICYVQDDGTLTRNATYNTNITDISFRNANGLFLLMWGGNQFSAAGGGSMQLTYTSVRG